jgi:O-antigen ligase
MIKLTTTALFFLAAGIFTSVTILSAYQILILIPMIYYTYLAFKNKTLFLPKSSYWLLAFALTAIVSLVINYELIPHPSKNFGRVKYFIFGICGIFIYRSWLPKVNQQTKKNLINLFFLSMIVASSYTMGHMMMTGVGRGQGLTETMRYGYGTGMILLTLLSILLHRHETKSWVNIPFALIAFVFGFLGMYFTYTRGALLGFLCGLPFAIFYYHRKAGIILGSVSLLAVITLGSIYLFGTKKYDNRFLSTKNNSSDVIRRSQWKAAIISIQEKPILGWGLSNFHSQLKRIKNDYDLDAKDYNDAHSHNLFLEVASGTGLIGFFFFLGWLISWAIECLKTPGLVRACIVPLGVAFVVSSQFEVTFDANNATMIFFLYSLSVSYFNSGKTSS